MPSPRHSRLRNSAYRIPTNPTFNPVSFPSDYQYSTVPPAYDGQFPDDGDLPNPWGDQQTQPRIRSHSTLGHGDSGSHTLVGDSNVMTFPEPMLYRSTSECSVLHRRGIQSEWNAVSSPSGSPMISAGSTWNQDDSHVPVEVAPQQSDDLSQQLSNLSLDSEEALRCFQTGQLLEQDQEWHKLVPSEARDALGKKEVQRQSVLFEVIKAERDYVADLETVSEVFIKGLKETSPPIIPESRISTFLNGVFGNLIAILTHHQRMLSALFARQREQHPLIQSIADIILDTVLLDRFRADYEVYIKHYPLSESLHRKELKSNPAYCSFLSTVSDDVRIRKRDIITFLSRPVTRLPRLNLLLENVLKSTDEMHDHPDLDTLPLILEVLGNFIKSTQPGIEAAESKVKFLALCESLIFQKGEIIDMDLYDESRTVVYSGAVSRLSPHSSWKDETAFLLDNYLILTREQGELNGIGKQYIAARPIHLSYLRLGLFTSPAFLRKEKVEDASLLDSLKSTPTVSVYPFTVFHESSKSLQRYTLYVSSNAVRKKWYSAFIDALGVHKVRQDANMWFYQQLLTERFFTATALNPDEATGRLSGKITSAVPFTSDGRKFLAVACAAGIYVSARGRDDFCRILNLPNSTNLAAILTTDSDAYNKLIIHHETSLYALSLDAIAKLALGTAEKGIVEQSMERVVPQDTPVAFFQIIQFGERVLSALLPLTWMY